MGIGILTDRDSGESVMYCNTDEVAFGPVFGADEDPAEFLEWLGHETDKDARSVERNPLCDFVVRWRNEVEENEAEASGERHFTEPGAWSGGFASNH